MSLTPIQEKIVALLAAGSTQSAAADAAGIHRNTITHWRSTVPEFQEAFARANYERVLFWREQSESVAQEAADAIRQIITAPETPASVRYKAADAILQRIAAPFPEPPPLPTVPAEAAPEPVPESAPAKTEIVHNFAQLPLRPAFEKVQTIRREGPKIGRNETCPCGSGIKFKRCCIDKRPVIPPLAA